MISSGRCASSPNLLILSLQDVYLVSEAEKRSWQPLPPSMYPKPLVFHDGRLAFKPTPMATLAMFLWLPLGAALAVFRALVFLSLPYNLAVAILSLSGMKSRLITPPCSSSSSNNKLYVCNHRTLLDPLYISGALRKPVIAATYSISRLSELLSPIKTVRLTRHKEVDRKKMVELLSHGDLIVCPEGTTCREPYILRFSPLFAELSDEVVPVAMKTSVGMFYGTTASGWKGLDPVFYLMNPALECSIDFLEKVVTTEFDGRRGWSSCEVANWVQGEIGRALGFECTALTRRDKYLMLTGNEGFVGSKAKVK